MTQNASAIILAGGRGSRIGHLYPHLPKPMIPAAGRPFLEWVIEHLAKQGIARFVVSLGHLGHVAEAYFQRRPADGLHIQTVHETEPLGTGGALIYAARSAPLSDPLVLVNGDSLLLADYTAAWKKLADERVDGVVVAVDVDDASRYGRLEVDREGRLRSFREKQPGRGAINAGVYFLKRRLLDRFPRATPLSMETQVFPELLAVGAWFAVHTCRAPFLDIGTPETVHQVDDFIRSTRWQSAADAA